MERCSCGQPYKTEAITYFPDKDTFKKNCPNCGRTLQVKAHAIDVEWTFDQNLKKSRNESCSFSFTGCGINRG